MDRIRRSRRIRGLSLYESIMAAGLTATVLVAGVAVFILAMASWYRGQGKIDAEASSQIAVRIASEQLRQAMAITVDADGYGLTYKIPAVDGTGAYALPLAWDGVTRRIELRSGNLNIVTGSSTRTICKNVIKTDPLTTGGTGTYLTFTSGAGTITRAITVMVVAQRNSFEAETVTSRSRETLYLRNIPVLTQ